MTRRAAFLLALLVLTPPLHAEGPFDPFDAARIEEKPGAKIPLDGPLLDQNGAPTTLAQIADGKPLLIVPVLHECPNICGVTLAGIFDAIARQHTFAPGEDFALVAFGIDPGEGPKDASADLARLIEARPDAADLAIAATTGAEPALRGVSDALGYHYAWDARIGQYAHAAAAAVVTPDGRLTRWLYGVTPKPDDLSRAIADAREGRTGGLLRQVILLCYHYDPQTGTYTLMIDKVVRYAGLATVIALGGLLFFLKRRWA